MRQEQKPTLHLHNNPGKYVAEARNLALELIPDTVEYFVEIIGHCTVEIEHIERLVSTMGKLQTSNDYTTGALGVSVVPRRGELGQVESWIEAALSSLLLVERDNLTNLLELRKPMYRHFVCTIGRHCMMLVVGIPHSLLVKIVIYRCE